MIGLLLVRLFLTNCLAVYYNKKQKIHPRPKARTDLTMHFKLFASASTLALTAMTTSIDAFPEQTLTETYLSEALA